MLILVVVVNYFVLSEMDVYYYIVVKDIRKNLIID